MNRIALLGWADPRKGALEGGGYNLILREQARFLTARGNKVFHLRSGRDYSLSWLWGRPGKPHIRRAGNYEGLHCFKLVNSGNRAPSVMNFHNRTSPSRDSGQNALVTDWLLNNKITRVVIHSLEGQALSLIGAIKSGTGAAVEVFCHDHFYLCPQVNLLKNGRSLCLDGWLKGECDHCLPDDRNRRYEAGRALEGSVFPPFRWIRLLYLGMRKKANNVTAVSQTEIIVPADPNSVYLKNRELQMEPNTYAYHRTNVLIDNLQRADRVISPSAFIARALEAAGMPRGRVEECTIGLPHLDQLKRRAEKTPAVSISSPLIFCFRGSEMPHKGLRVFLDALPLIPREIREFCGFIVRGISDPEKYESYRRLVPELEIFGQYSPEELPGFISEYHIGVLPHLWFENSPVALLEHLASGKPVLTSPLGGVLEFITPGKNGWFFSAGDASALAERITRIVKEKDFLPPAEIQATIPWSEDFLKTI